MQLELFNDNEIPRPNRPRRKGNSSAVYHDYEGYIAKFTDVPKTTDETYTPQDVYNAVVEYVGSVYDMRGKVILRPFYPNGDYENEYYPDNGVVIDNPPFSILVKICAFYAARAIPYFLFAPALTMGNLCRFGTAIIVGNAITFENKANVACGFISNLFGDIVIMTAPKLGASIARCESQSIKANLPSFKYPENVLSVSELQTIARGGVEYRVSASDCVPIKSLDGKRGGGILRYTVFISYYQRQKQKQKPKQRQKQKQKQKGDKV